MLPATSPETLDLFVCEDKVQRADSQHRASGLGVRGTALCGTALLCAVLKTLQENKIQLCLLP